MQLTSLGKNIEFYRKAKKLSQEELAQKSEVTRSFLSSIEKGRKNISIQTLARLCEGLGIEIADVFSRISLEGGEELGTRRFARFLKLGGTWDMVTGEAGLQGAGQLDDEQFAALERKGKSERELLDELVTLFAAQEATREVGAYFRWAKKVRRFIKGPFIPLFSGDSSHYRSSLIAAALAYIFKQLKRAPRIPLLIGMGTDTADLFLPLLDAFLFDSNVQPVLVTGANRSHHESDSDAPQNFNDLALAAHLPLAPGAYYIFDGLIYRSGDLVKVDPREAPHALEGMTTFFAPHRTHLKLANLERSFQPAATSRYEGEQVQAWSATAIFQNLEKILTINAGHLNSVEFETEMILDPRWKAVIVQSHALGNLNNPLKEALITAVKQGKIVVNVSRCLVPEISNRYVASTSTVDGIIDGSTVSANLARGLVLRALLENQTTINVQALFDHYAKGMGKSTL